MWTKHHWFSEYALVCYTSDLKLAMLEKYTFISKILFMQNFIHALWFKWFQAIFFFKTCPCATHIYILLALCQNPLNINFSGSFRSFRNCRASFHRTYPASVPDMSGSQVYSLYKGPERPLRTLGLFFSSTPSLVATKGSLGNFGSSPPNLFGFLEIWLPFSPGSLNLKWFSLS
jgi:hypothetical protein